MDDMQSDSGREAEPKQGRDAESEQRTPVTIRRAPKISVFVVVGALIGLLAALILTSAFEVDPTVGFSATFGYLLLYCLPLGGVLGAIVALLLDGRSSRRASEVIAGKLEVHPDEDSDRSDGAAVSDSDDKN